MKKTFVIEVDCANCANKMETAAAKTPGIRSAVVNFMGQKLILEFEEGQDVAAVTAAVVKNCRRAVHDCEIYL